MCEYKKGIINRLKYALLVAAISVVASGNLVYATTLSIDYEDPLLRCSLKPSYFIVKAKTWGDEKPYLSTYGESYFFFLPLEEGPALTQGMTPSRWYGKRMLKAKHATGSFRIPAKPDSTQLKDLIELEASGYFDESDWYYSIHLGAAVVEGGANGRLQPALSIEAKLLEVNAKANSPSFLDTARKGWFSGDPIRGNHIVLSNNRLEQVAWNLGGRVSDGKNPGEIHFGNTLFQSPHLSTFMGSFFKQIGDTQEFLDQVEMSTSPNASVLYELSFMCTTTDTKTPEIVPPRGP